MATKKKPMVKDWKYVRSELFIAVLEAQLVMMSVNHLQMERALIPPFKPDETISVIQGEQTQALERLKELYAVVKWNAEMSRQQPRKTRKTRKGM